MKKTTLIWVAVLAVLVLAPAAAFAALAGHGPIVPYVAGPPASGNGFPQYYIDALGQAADMPVPPFGIAAGKQAVVPPPTMTFFPPITNTLDPNFQFSNDIGFDLEAFYWSIVPDSKPLPLGGGFDPPIWGSVGKFNCIIGLECGFATPNPVGEAQNGQQGVFQRIRIDWVAVPQAGFYVFKHPFGEETITVAAADIGVKGLKLTIDTPLVTNVPPGNFDIAVGNTPGFPGKIGPFLSQVNPQVQISVLVPPIPPPYNLPTDWFGDGVTEATFTGSPLVPAFNEFQFQAFTDSTRGTPLNLFTVPPGLPGAGTITNTMTTTTAIISGHKFVIPAPVFKKGKVGGMIDLLLLQ